ncbi:MAG: hypothetical protein KGP12_02165 [Actinomycetales bacterium]|nr:hypothetical protein [Actinomycetales bacterium]
MTITRQATVLVPRPPGSVSIPPSVPDRPGTAPAGVLFGQPEYAGTPASSQPTSAPALEPVTDAWSWRRGRHRARGGWGLRFAAIIASIICLGGALGAGWSVGERWAQDDGESITAQLTHWVDGVRDWALGM